MATRAEHEWRARGHAHSGNALPYDYRSTSRSYRKGERFAENYGDDAMRNSGRYEYRRHHQYSRYGYGEGGYDGYGEDQSREEPYAEGPGDDYSEGAAEPMSINSPSALDPWNGYGADCPYRGE